MAEFASLLQSYRTMLLDDIIPFWTRHAIDPAGGLNCCIADDGKLLSRDKWMWSQWRAVWVFAKLYNRIEKRKEWLDLALHIAEFCRKYAWDEGQQVWNLCVSGDGHILRGADSIYSDAFAMYGLAELIHATGAQWAKDLARKTADSAIARFAAKPHSQIPSWPYPVPENCKSHGLVMIFALGFFELGTALGEKRYLDMARQYQEEIFRHFYRRDRDVILERIAQDNTELPAPEGTAIVPGHVIEDMWFQTHIARATGNRRIVHEACGLVQRHLELGWDDEYGGIFLAVDADGGADVAWGFAETKVWWPHTEALYATLLAYEVTGEKWALDWHQKVREYSLAHYPNPNGEWTQRLDRMGKPMTEFVALPVKDPFHLPRALIYCIDVLERLVD